MQKKWLIAALLFTLVLTACQAAPQGSADANTSDADPMECTLSSLFPEPLDLASAKLPEISNDDWARGATDAKLTIVEYSDFQCPYCSIAGRTLQEFEAAHPDDVQVIFRHFPLPGHDKSNLAAQAAEAAGSQDKFWEMHDLLFAEANWETWTAMSLADFESWLVEQAGTLGLDSQKFTKDLTSDAVVSKVEKAYGSAISSDLNSTPSFYFFVDGELVFVPADQIPYDLMTLEEVLTLAKLDSRQYAECPPMIVDPARQYTANIKTSQGDFSIKLYADQAPLAVNSFIFLAGEGWFDNVSFHRVLPGFVAQTGDPSGTGFGGPGYEFKNEVNETLKYDRAGLVGMANGGADTNGSQFFITYAEAPSLNGGYTIFGEVISGMDVVEKLTPRDPGSDGELPDPDAILSVSIEVK